MTNTVLREPSELVERAIDLLLPHAADPETADVIDGLHDLIERLTPTPELPLKAASIELALDCTLGVGEWDQTHEEAFAAGVKYARDTAPTPEPCRLREALVEARHYIANCWIDPVAADEERALLARIDSALKQGCAK